MSVLFSQIQHCPQGNFRFLISFFDSHPVSSVTSILHDTLLPRSSHVLNLPLVVLRPVHLLWCQIPHRCLPPSSLSLVCCIGVPSHLLFSTNPFYTNLLSLVSCLSHLFYSSSRCSILAVLLWCSSSRNSLPPYSICVICVLEALFLFGMHSIVPQTASAKAAKAKVCNRQMIGRYIII